MQGLIMPLQEMIFELVFDVPLAEVEIMQKLVKEEMEGAIELSVPLTVAVGVGKNWREAH